MQRGKSGSYRVLAYYREQDNTIYPFFVYQKKEYEKFPGQQPTASDIRKWLKSLISSMPSAK
jgi:hypothetical protein